MVLDSIREAYGWTITDVRQHGLHSVSCQKILRDMAQYGLSPKSVLQGIPEWRVLQSNFHIIIERCSQMDCNHASYADLLETARILNVRTRTNKKRLTVRQLQNKLKQTLHQQSRKKQSNLGVDSRSNGLTKRWKLNYRPKA